MEIDVVVVGAVTVVSAMRFSEVTVTGVTVADTPMLLLLLVVVVVVLATLLQKEIVSHLDVEIKLELITIFAKHATTNLVVLHHIEWMYRQHNECAKAVTVIV